MNIIKPVKAGQPITASKQNMIIGSVNALRRRYPQRRGGLDTWIKFGQVKTTWDPGTPNNYIEVYPYDLPSGSADTSEEIRVYVFWPRDKTSRPVPLALDIQADDVIMYVPTIEEDGTLEGQEIGLVLSPPERRGILAKVTATGSPAQAQLLEDDYTTTSGSAFSVVGPVSSSNGWKSTSDLVVGDIGIVGGSADNSAVLFCPTEIASPPPGWDDIKVKNNVRGISEHIVQSR